MSSPPPAPQPVAPAPPAPPAAKAKPHVLGIVALIVAAIGFIFACIPGALIVGWILLPIAFVLAIVAFFLKGSKWPAITALIVAVVGTIVGFVVFFALVANAASEAFNANSNTSTESSPAASEPAESADPVEEPAADYVVTIDGAKQVKDYEGKKALVVTFTFTNNSDEARSFGTSTMAKAFQDGIELETAILLDDTKYMGNWMKDIKPGKTIKVQEAFVLDGTQEVTVEVTELISFDDTPLDTKTFAVE
ncbi:MAG: DUF5067 domain-containing protein [Microbacterium sp.]|uniref:DUF5067 domain-containing protein n=1 Tax=Microbacterium sp. TaxID=51671 RepID=UPI0039E33892